MLNLLALSFDSVLSSNSNAVASISIKEAMLCTGVSLILGVVIALVCRISGNKSGKSFLTTLAILPAIVQIVIMLVNGNLGVGISVMGAFSLVRFRSIPGTGKEISCIFFAMAIGLATGMGYLTYAALATLIIGVAIILLHFIDFGSQKAEEKVLKVTIPENLDFTGIFDDLFEKYTNASSLDRVKTTNMGSLYELTYTIELKDISQEKKFIDEMRCRNGNLTISCGKKEAIREEL